MSTRGEILVKIKDSDVGKKVKVNPSLLTDSETSIERFNNKCFEIELSGKYGEIYCHHDSYPNGLGKALVTNFNDYDKALNLILGGDTSGVGDMSACYVAIVDDGEWYEDVKPDFYDEIPRMSEEYQYLFEDGQWFVRSIHGSISDFVSVSEYLKQ